MRKSNKKDGEPLTLDSLMSELNSLFGSRKDDTAAKDIKSMIKSLVNGEACFEEEDEQPEMITTEDGNVGIDISNEDLSGGMIGYDCLYEAANAKEQTVKDQLGDDIPLVAFVSAENMMEGVVDTIRSMKFPTIIASETDKSGNRLITKAFVACGETRTNLLEHGATIPALVFDEKSGICRLSINRKDGYDFIFGENGVTRFIIFDESVCPATIPTDIVSDDHKWGKRMSSELPKLIEKRIEESKSEEKKLPFADAVKPALTKIDIPNLSEKKSAMCNLPETCAFENCQHDVKKPLIADIMKDFADAKGSGKVGKDTFVEFMKPENKNAVATAVATSIAERQNPSDATVEPNSDEVFANDVLNAFTNSSYSERWKRDSDTKEEKDDFTDEDTNPDCFRCIAEYMAKEGVDSISFWTDGEGLIHCDVQIKTVYKVELEDSEKK